MVVVKCDLQLVECSSCVIHPQVVTGLVTVAGLITFDTAVQLRTHHPPIRQKSMAARTPLLRALTSLSSTLSSSLSSTTSLLPAAATALNVFSSNNAAAQQQSGTRSYCATHLTQPCRNLSPLNTARSSIALPRSLSAAGLRFSSGGSTAGTGDGAGSSSSSSSSTGGTDGSGSSTSLQV